jgi:hypothetical protein
MPLNPALRKVIDDAKAKACARRPAKPDTFIDDSRFHDLVATLKDIVGPTDDEDEAVDKAITEALLDIAGVAPASWREIYDR